MFLEHFIWTAALVVFIGYLYKRFTGRDPWWIMIIGTMMPDSDYIFQTITYYTVGGNSPLFIYHTEFHNIFICIVISVTFAYLLNKYIKVPYVDGFIYTIIGFSAHLLEDMFVYPTGVTIFAPFNGTPVVFNIFPNYTPSFFSLFNPDVMLIGLLLLAGMVLIRTGIEGIDWITDVKELIKTHFLTTASKQVG